MGIVYPSVLQRLGSTTLATIALLTCVAGCATRSPAVHRSDPAADQLFQMLTDEFLARYLAWRPQAAASMGLHEYDGRTTDLSRASIRFERDRLIKFRERFAAFDGKSLSPPLDRQRRIILAAIDGELFRFDAQRAYFRNPMTYSEAFDLTLYAKRDFAPLDQRLRSAIAILKDVPLTLFEARRNLEPHLPRVFIKTSIEEARGAADFFSNDLVKAFAAVKDDELQARFREAHVAASQAMQQYARWLETERLPGATEDYAISRDAFVAMLRNGEMINESPEDILKLAMHELKLEQQRFADAANRIDSSRPAVEVYKAIQREHPTEQSLIPDTVKHLEAIRQFVVQRNLVGFPTNVRVKVEETPSFARATSFASMDTPGVFETKATESFYYVTPVEPHWDAKRKEEWLTAFNYYTTDIVSIHEAYPGHFVQALHLKASPVSRAEKMFGSYAYTEGWAHYTEQMLLDEGFPANVDDVTRAKYRLAQSGEALLRLCRLCCAITLHTQDMSVADATKFFMDNCYYEEATARAEAERGAYDPGYGFYTLGKLQILKLRDDYHAQQGERFNLRQFHDAILQHGQPPIRILREILLSDPSKWNETLPSAESGNQAE